MARDSGWAWVIVISGFFVGFLCDGIRNSYGLLYLEFLSEFGESKSVTSWVGSMMFGIMNFLGPVTSILVNRFGCRTVTVAGGIICSLGYITSFFATRVYHLYITLGIFGGVGFSMLVIPFNVMIIQYFVRRRALAMGIATCGSGVGSIVFSPLTKWMIDQFGWRGTLLIDGALVLHCVPCGLLMRPLLSHGDQQETQAVHATEEYGSDVSQSCLHSTHDHELTVIAESNIYRTENNVLDDKCTEHHSLQTLDRERSDTETQSMNLNGTGVNNVSNHKADTHEKSWRKDFQNLFHISILKNVAFIIVMFSYLFEGLAYSVPFTFLPDLVVSLGYTRFNATVLLSVIAITNTTSRVPVGVFADVKCVNRLYMYICALALVGVCIIFMAIPKDLTVLICICAMYGIFLGSYVVLLPLVLADLFGDALLSETKGFTCFVNGVAGLIGLPIAGALFDVSGTYTPSFVVAGSEYIIGGAVLIFTTCTIRNRSNKSS